MSTGPKRIIRNPITGEELHYTKGPKHPQAEQKSINYDLDHDQRVNELLHSSRSEFIKPNLKQEKSQQTLNSELSVIANASSIPLLNFTDLNSSDRNLNRDNKLSDFRNQNPIIAPILFEKSARPISTYNHSQLQNDKLDSPLLAYHNKLKNELIQQSKSPLISHLDAPRGQDVIGPAVKKKDSIYLIERVADLEKLWLNNGSQTPKYLDDSKTLNEKLVIDTVVTDQLSRFVLSEPENSNNQKTVYTSRGNRFTLNDNHSKPTSSLSENALAKKCKFHCRVRTPNGRIALRELFGILFLHDGSLTIYEFRLLCNVNKKANALPFMSRKVYTHEFGRRKGEQVQIWDLYKGSRLYLPCSISESSLPNTVRQQDFIEIEVTDVDELEKENVLASFELQNHKLSSEEMNKRILEIKERLKSPLMDVELNDLKIVNSVRKFMRKQIEDRSVEVYIGLSSSLKKRSIGNEMGQFGYVNEQDFYDALIEYSVKIHTEDLKIVWQILDLDSVGYLSYYVVMRAYFGEMGSLRHGFFRSLVHKLDTQKVGFIQVGDVYKYYKASMHPRVRSGDLKEDEMFRKFLESFDLLPLAKVTDFFQLSSSTDTKSPLISYEQFEEYYNGLSIVLDSDEDFINILKNSWN